MRDYFCGKKERKSRDGKDFCSGLEFSFAQMYRNGTVIKAKIPVVLRDNFCDLYANLSSCFYTCNRRPLHD